MESGKIALSGGGAIAFPMDDGAWHRAAVEWLTNFQSHKTRTTYRAAWHDFISWLKPHPAMVTRADVIAYRDHLVGEGKRSSTINVRLAALASFYAHATVEGLIKRNPTEGITRPKVEAFSAARWLTTSEAAQLLNAPDRSTIEGRRDFAILTVMLTMGLRRSEVVAMHIGDLAQRSDGTAELRYKPKGGEDKTRPMPGAAWKAIRVYLDARGALSDNAPVFVAHDHAAKGHSRDTALTSEAIRLIVARHSQRALGRAINPHALRHTCAGTAWDTTHDLRRVQGLLGHSSATTTEKYLHRREDDRAALGDALAVSFGIR